MNAQTALRSRRIGALSFLALQRFSQGKCVFPGVKVQGSVTAVMAASVFAAGVAAFAVLVVVMAAANVGVILKNVVYEGGCNGGTQDAFSALCKGKTIDYCVERMSGILCHGSKGSSCPDQTAKALAQAKVVITGEGCANCGEAK